MPGVVERHFQPVVTRFLEALKNALPHLPEEEVLWRAHFMIGAMAISVVSSPKVMGNWPADFQSRLKRLITFLSAGFRAPAPVLEEVEANK